MSLLRKILFPFSLVYGGIGALRNLFYDKGWLQSKAFDLPIICVGNLSTGGTGKSPLIEFLVRLLKDDYKIAVLSRGYRRKSKGFREVFPESKVEETGDEPLQFKRKFPEIQVAVCADRREGIQKLMNTAGLVLLDDAFQHRKVKASVTILLTPFHDLYVDDFVLPTGNLREFKAGAKRADIIIITKCPENLSAEKRAQLRQKLEPAAHQKVYFAGIDYAEEAIGAERKLPLNALKNQKFTLVTGIADASPLLAFLKKGGFDFNHAEFPDHHHFSENEIETLQKSGLLLTTEKDFMRLKQRIKPGSLFYLPIKTVFLNEEKSAFANRLRTYL